MKIKCPICGLLFDYEGNPINSHIWLEHDEEEINQALHIKIIQIHEKIESLETDGRLLKMQPLELLIKELKSLLDNQK